MVSQVTNLWGLFDEDYNQNIQKKDTLTLLVNLVFWGIFEDILTKFYSSRVWVLDIHSDICSEYLWEGFEVQIVIELSNIFHSLIRNVYYITYKWI